MISKLKGIIDTITETNIIIDVGGVGYGVHVSAKTIATLTPNTPATLFIETIVREDAITLYGFTVPDELEFFRLLTTVQGVGPKAGLSILSTLTPTQITTAILSHDDKAFTAANGIGGKTATRIISELKDKVTKLKINLNLNHITNQTSTTTTAANDAISALNNMGYSQSQSFEIVIKIATEQPTISTNDLIKEALKKINNF